jgi:hypothetical protein
MTPAMRPTHTRLGRRVKPGVPIFPGWYVVAGAFAVTLVGFGIPAADEAGRERY